MKAYFSQTSILWVLSFVSILLLSLTVILIRKGITNKKLMKMINKGFDKSCFTLSSGMHQGKRERQEDYILLEKGDQSNKVIAVLCDGMGGISNGNFASQYAAHQFINQIKETSTFEHIDFIKVVKDLSRGLYSEGASRTGEAMGTTLIGVIVENRKMRFVSVGDSRLYLLNDLGIKSLNEQHNYFNELMKSVEKGRLSIKEAQLHPDAVKLTSYIGIENLELVDYSDSFTEYKAGDRLVLCSDGVFGTLSDDEIWETVMGSVSNEIAKNLISATLMKNNEYQDNISVISFVFNA